jgi:tetratricopeptide (TPR) repeat protein
MADHGSTTRRLNAALAHHRAGEFDDAESLYRRVLADSPGQVDALHLLGVLAYQTGRLDVGAQYIEEAITIAPAVPDFHLNLGNIFQAEGNFARARESYGNALQLDPRNPTALNNMANTLIASGEPAVAVELLESAIALQPRLAMLHLTLGNANRDCGSDAKAASSYQVALELDATLVAAWVNLGSVSHAMGDPEKAHGCYRRALALAPDQFEIHYNTGNLHQERGEFDTAIECYECALELKNDHAKSIYNIALSRKYRSSDHSDRRRLDRLLADPETTGVDRAYLEFAMGKLLDDAGKYGEAFSHFRRANELVGVRLDRKRHERFVNRLIDTFDERYFERQAEFGAASKKPVFILGMPRSGTSLVEQILSHHPLVSGGGELPQLDQIVENLPSEVGAADPYPECVPSLDGDSVRSLSRRYLDRLNEVSQSAYRVTDKSPLNYLYLGLIATFFPGASVVHCRRNAIDTCLSCYFQFFARKLDFAFDLTDLGFYYRQYERLMDHWRRTAPIEIHDVHYEELIADTAAVARNLTAACGLEWDDVCLEYHKSRRTVKTASSWQVRQPVYRSSIGRWKRYQAHISPLVSVLGDGWADRSSQAFANR